MSDPGGGDGPDRPRWEGFPGGIDPLDPSVPYDPNATGPIPGGGYQPPVQPETPVQPEPPQFPVQPPGDQTAPIPVIGASAIGPEPVVPVAAADGAGRRRAHAAPKPHTSRYVAFACAGAVLVLGGGLAFAGCNNDDVATSGSGTPPTSVGPITSSPTASPTPTQTVPTSSPTASPSRSASGSPKASATGEPEESPTATATAAAQKQPVVVLNSTGIQGLAKRVAVDLQAEGWAVPRTANWTGAQPAATTIYYLPGKKNEASAKRFNKEFSVTSVVKPALPGMTSNLTLVLTRDAA